MFSHFSWHFSTISSIQFGTLIKLQISCGLLLHTLSGIFLQTFVVFSSGTCLQRVVVKSWQISVGMALQFCFWIFLQSWLQI